MRILILSMVWSIYEFILNGLLEDRPGWRKQVTVGIPLKCILCLSLVPFCLQCFCFLSARWWAVMYHHALLAMMLFLTTVDPRNHRLKPGNFGPKYIFPHLNLFFLVSATKTNKQTPPPQHLLCVMFMLFYDVAAWDVLQVRVTSAKAQINWTLPFSVFPLCFAFYSAAQSWGLLCVNSGDAGGWVRQKLCTAWTPPAGGEMWWLE